jgi:hypothetical protein
LRTISAGRIDEDARDAIRDAINDLRDLVEHPGWTRLRRAIDRHKEEVRSSLGSTKQTESIEKVRLLQGELQGLDWVLGAPDREIEGLAAALTTSQAES